MTEGLGSFSALTNKLDFQFAPNRLRIALECGKRGRMFTGRLQARNRAFGCTHERRNSLLSQASLRSGRQHLISKGILDSQTIVGLGETLAL